MPALGADFLAMLDAPAVCVVDTQETQVIFSAAGAYAAVMKQGDVSLFAMMGFGLFSVLIATSSASNLPWQGCFRAPVTLTDSFAGRPYPLLPGC